jgi:hypothetical protein
VAKCESSAASMSYTLEAEELDRAVPGFQSRSPQATARTTIDRLVFAWLMRTNIGAPGEDFRK